MEIFLLENNEIFISQFSKFVKKNWYDIIVCKSIRDFSFSEYDLYLIDLQLWDWFSFDVIKEISLKTSKPIAMFTHHTDKVVLEKWISAGANYYFPKMEIDMYSIHLKILWNIKSK